MQRAKLPQTRARGEYEMENTIKVLQHKESKLSGTSFLCLLCLDSCYIVVVF